MGFSNKRLETGNLWTVSVLSDIQNYAVEDELIKRVKWISESKDRYNMVFATHDGNMVGNGSIHEQRDRIRSALSCLDEKVPYGVVPGNYDWETTYERSSRIGEYLARFGEKRLEDKTV